MTIVSTPHAPAAVGPYSQAVEADGLIFVSGQLPLDPATGTLVEGAPADMTRQTMRNVRAILEAAGSSLDKVLKTTIYLADLDAFSEVNQAYAGFFGEAAPARACVEVSALPKGALLEIEAIARK